MQHWAIAEAMTDAQLRQLMRRAIAANPERRLVLEWVLLEWDAYADDKWDNARQAHEDNMVANGWAHDGFWNIQVNNYLDRAGTEYTGPSAKQAAMKAGCTLLDGLACMIRNLGKPPAPGHTSGEIKGWE